MLARGCAACVCASAESREPLTDGEPCCALACVRACGRTVAARGLSRDAANLAGNPAPAEERELSPHELLQRTLRSAAADAAQARRDSPSAAKARKDSPSDQLAKLAALNSEGIIDNDQYLKAKARVMAELQKQRTAEADAAPDRQARGRGSAAPTPARAEDGEKQHEEDRRGAPDVTGEKSEMQKEAHAADEQEKQREKDRKKAREGGGEKSERQKEEEERAQKQRGEDRKDAPDAGYSAEAQEIVGSDDRSEKQKEKKEQKHQAQSGAGAAAAAAAAAIAGTENAAKEDTAQTKAAQKAPVHKLMDRGGRWTLARQGYWTGTTNTSTRTRLPPCLGSRGGRSSILNRSPSSGTWPMRHTRRMPSSSFRGICSLPWTLMSSRAMTFMSLLAALF